MNPNPFRAIPNTGRTIKAAKNLNFDEAFMDIQEGELDTIDDEREVLNYRFLSSIAVILLAILGIRVFHLQVVEGPDYKALAEDNKLRVQYTLAPRGLVQDRYGQVIVGNVPSFEAVVVPADLAKEPAEFERNLSKVAQIVNHPYDELLAILKKMDQDSYQPQTLVEGISKDQNLGFDFDRRSR
jgi:cell division protein FtsI/penicillin-binding protein 2